MKIKKLFLFAAISICFSANNAFAGNPEIMIIGYPDISNHPYETGEGENINLEKPGVNLEILQLIAAELDIKIIFKRYPWKRGLAFLSEGRIDGLFGASYNEERLKHGRYPMKNGSVDETRMFFELAYVLFKMKSSQLEWDGHNFKNLSGKGIGVVLGYSIGSDLKKNGTKINETNSEYANMQMLVLNRIDGFAGYSVSGNAILSKYPEKFKNVVEVGPPLKNKPYYLMISHQFYNQHQELSEKIWDTIKIYRDSDKVKKIYEKYVD